MIDQRPGDQPPPTPTTGPGMHDLVIADLRDGDPVYGPVADELADRRRIGLDRYGTMLQAHNGRDALRDLLDELLDAIAYTRQATTEGVLPAGPSIEAQLVATTTAVIMQRGR